ncbi:hypothetical protein HF086_016962 [Spodoptera exigua]|uniref:Uncharacterized protein n=1 Tax=Spodoptera exigua TaxID=7107 RepID=A0A922SAS0_SPOEX|nr:hypothetical protein HF086_016962 [Spodoptera exigua]
MFDYPIYGVWYINFVYIIIVTASRRELGALVSCSALAGDAERAAAARAKLHDAHAHNPYYDFLYALHVSRHHYRKGGDNIDFDMLYPKLKDADPETLLSVLKRAISTGQFLPHWFLQTYLEKDGAGMVRALLGGGRAGEAGAACCAALRRALHVLLPRCPAAPRAAPLALADMLLAELAHHTHDAYIQQVYNELDGLVKEYTKVVIRISDDMKQARLEHAVN